MTASDPGLTDLIENLARGMYDRATESVPLWPKWSGANLSTREVWLANAALVVEQHTNGRIAELHEQRDNAIEAGLAAIDRAEKAEATIARVRAVEADYLDPEDTDIECREDVWRFIRDLRAALEGVGDADPT
ncbi:hypothetical protein ACS7JX_19055 [Rhodococcus erythropolis]